MKVRPRVSETGKKKQATYDAHRFKFQNSGNEIFICPQIDLSQPEILKNIATCGGSMIKVVYISKVEMNQKDLYGTI